MADLAQLGFKVETGDLTNAATKLQALVPPADKAEKAASKLEKQFIDVNTAAGRAASGVAGASSAMDSAATGANRAAIGMQAAANATTSAANAMNKAAGSSKIYTGQLDDNMKQINRNIVLMTGGFGKSTGALNGFGKSAKLRTDEMLNLSRQFADIGVTAAMGMSPLMILIQQGPQIADIFGSAAQRGVGFTAVLKQIGVAVGLLRVVNVENAVANGAVAASATAATVATNGLAAAETRAAGSAQAATVAAGELAVANTAIATTATVAAAAEAVALAPLALIIGGIVAALALVAAGFGLLSRSVRTAGGDMSATLGLTDKQMDELAKKGVDTGITFGDTFKAVFQVAGQYISDAFGPQLKWLSDTFTATLDNITWGVGEAIVQIVGFMTGGVDMIAAVWQDIPAVIGDLFVQGANLAIDGINGIINGARGVFDSVVETFMNIPTIIGNLFAKGAEAGTNAFYWLLDKTIEIAGNIINGFRNIPTIIRDLFYQAATGAISAISWLYNKIVETIKHLMAGDLGHFVNPNEGAAAAAGEKAGKAFADGRERGMKNARGVYTDILAQAGANRNSRVIKAAGDPGEPKKPRKGPKTDAEKFADIVTGANNDIAATQAKINGVNLTAEAAARLVNEQKLLNEATSKGITLTPAWRAQLMALAGTLTDAQMKLKNLEGFKAISEGADKSLAALKATGAQIGLVGQAALEAKYNADLLAEAIGKGLSVNDPAYAAQVAKLKAQAHDLAAQGQSNDNKTYYEDSSKAIAENIDNLNAELAALGQSAEATARLAAAQKILNDEKYRGKHLSDQQKQDLIDAAAHQAVLTEKLQKHKEALDFTKDAAKGFFHDILDDLKQGKSLWAAFGDAAMNALDKLLNKLLDKGIDAAINAIFNAMNSSGGFADGGGFDIGGALGFANGDTFGTATPFAKGGGFSNSVVSSPTLFSFANGTALGQMGEAGPEAIMPLERGPDGSLGVQMYGGNDGGGQMINAPVQVDNHYNITGAVSSADIVELNKRSAEQTKTQVKRELNGWIAEIQANGTTVG